MLKSLLILELLLAHGICERFGQFFQTDFILKTERLEIVDYNKNYIGNVEFKNFKYNRTTYALNASATWKIDIQGPLIAIIQAYKFSSNEYRLFPIYFTVNVCDALEKNTFGLQNVYKCGNFFRCPIKKGHYRCCNWDIDYEQLPPRFPRGRYMYEVIWKNNNILVIKFNIYVEIIDVPLPY